MNQLLPIDSFTPAGAVNQFRKETAERCNEIDKRISDLETDQQYLISLADSIASTTPTGWYDMWKTTRKLKKICGQMAINRSLLTILYHKRIANT